MQFLLTNDDGIQAPGLQALWEAACQIGKVVVVAPHLPQSGCGHRVTTDGQLRVEKQGPDRFSVHGTPADCVRLARHGLAPETTWVLSGINAGGNLGADVHHSGTVAAVREGVLHGVPGIALSQYLARGRPVDWERAAGWAHDVIRRLMARPWVTGTFWNVNFPQLAANDRDPEVVFCPLDPSPLPLKFHVEADQAVYAGDYQARARRPGSDVDVCFGGRIAVTLVPASAFESA
jgi:5'-nucleotidase